MIERIRIIVRLLNAAGFTTEEYQPGSSWITVLGCRVFLRRRSYNSNTLMVEGQAFRYRSGGYDYAKVVRHIASIVSKLLAEKDSMRNDAELRKQAAELSGGDVTVEYVANTQLYYIHWCTPSFTQAGVAADWLRESQDFAIGEEPPVEAAEKPRVARAYAVADDLGNPIADTEMDTADALSKVMYYDISRVDAAIDMIVGELLLVGDEEVGSIRLLRTA